MLLAKNDYFISFIDRVKGTISTEVLQKIGEGPLNIERTAIIHSQNLGNIDIIIL